MNLHKVGMLLDYHVDRVGAFNIPLTLAYVDLKAAFDSVDCTALWLLLRSLDLPEKIVGLVQELYTDTVSSVRVERTLSNWFEITSGVCLL